MKKSGRFLVFALMCTLLVASGACSRIVDKMLPDDVDGFARHCMDTLRRGDIAAAGAYFHSSQINDGFESRLAVLVNPLNIGAADDTRPINFKSTKMFTGKPFTRYTISYYVHYSNADPKRYGGLNGFNNVDVQPGGEAHQIVQVLIRKENGVFYMMGLHVRPAAKDPTKFKLF